MVHIENALAGNTVEVNKNRNNLNKKTKYIYDFLKKARLSILVNQRSDGIICAIHPSILCRPAVMRPRWLDRCAVSAVSVVYTRP